MRRIIQMENMEFELDQQRLNSMKIRIMELEKQNLKTRELKEAQMIDAIKEIIMEEVKKKY